MNCWKSYGDDFLRTFLKYNNSKFRDQFKIINDRASRSVEFNPLYDFDGQYEIIKYFSLNNHIYLIFVDNYITFRWRKDKFSKFECNIYLSPLEVYCLLTDISNMKFERNTKYFHYSCKAVNYNLDTIFKPYDKERNILRECERDFISNEFWSKHSKSGYTECMAEFLESCSYLDNKSNFVYFYNSENEDVVILDTNTGEVITWYKMFHIGGSNRTNMMTDIQITNFSDRLYDFLIKTFTRSYSIKDSISDNTETVENKRDRNIEKIQLNSIYGVCYNPSNMETITSDDPNLKAEEYEAQEIPLKIIEQMIKNGTWKDSLEEEEVVYNLENNLYSKEYTINVKKLLNL